MRASVSIEDVTAEVEDDAPFSSDHAKQMLAVSSAEAIVDYEATFTAGDPRPEDAAK